ncbi:hypothetical protein [Corynebacterium tapiri]|uniref:Uncharacterized protein n=1 Tax=Corynebacterium tapiri TaxID=1448266 RepID=A0A5C4U4Y2_9CORY|nr:hypothetical protein [Corynebacterium tapiri]TNL98767.1 hypothetical protein FHE74_03880 [Corynebacterium tapiri]
MPTLTPVSVDNGTVSFEAVPGPAVLVVSDNGGVSEQIELLIPESATASLELCITGARVADEGTRAEIERLAADALKAVEAAKQAKVSQDAASQSAQAAGASKDEAQRQAQTATSQAQAAKASQDAAKASASQADQSKSAAAQSASQANDSKAQAAQSAQAASTSKNEAAASAEEAGTARQGAETARDLAKQYADSAQTGIKPDTVTRAMLKPELRGEIDGKAPASHTHSDLQAALDGKADKTAVQPTIDDVTASTYSATPGTLMKRTSTGAVSVASPTASVHAANKSYVDDAVSGKINSAEATQTANGGKIVKRWDTGQISVPLVPDSSGAATSKQYVDGELAKKVNSSDTSTAATGGTVVRRWNSGQISVPLIPDNADVATSKQYVDQAIAEGGGGAFAFLKYPYTTTSSTTSETVKWSMVRKQGAFSLSGDTQISIPKTGLWEINYSITFASFFDFTYETALQVGGKTIQFAQSHGFSSWQLSNNHVFHAQLNFGDWISIRNLYEKAAWVGFNSEKSVPSQLVLKFIG